MAAGRITVFATSSVPPGIRGALNQWMVEVLPGIFVGRMNTRIRKELWTRLVDALLDVEGAYAAMIEPAETEQGFAFQTVGTNMYEVADFMGLQLVVRHHTEQTKNTPAAILGGISP